MNDVGSLNHVMLRGNVGAAPIAMAPVAGGYARVRFRLRTSRLWKNSKGQWQELEQWHSLMVLGERAETLLKKVGMGTHLYVEGALENQSWDDKKTGVRRERTFIRVSHFVVLGRGLKK